MSVSKAQTSRQLMDIRVSQNYLFAEVQCTLHLNITLRQRKCKQLNIKPRFTQSLQTDVQSCLYNINNRSMILQQITKLSVNNLGNRSN